jgi:hypothetical protein
MMRLSVSPAIVAASRAAWRWESLKWADTPSEFSARIIIEPPADRPLGRAKGRLAVHDLLALRGTAITALAFFWEGHDGGSGEESQAELIDVPSGSS